MNHIVALPVTCLGCGERSIAAGRHPDKLCLVCESRARKRAGK